MYIRLGPGISPAGKNIWPDGERCRFLPLMAFHSVSRRHASGGVERVKILGVVLHRRWRSVYHFFRASLPGSLGISRDTINLLREQHAQPLLSWGCRLVTNSWF